jgi:hypothetical protein
MSDIPCNTGKVVLLSNGDIFEIGAAQKTFHFEYEDGFDQFGQTKWKRTGEALTGNKVNELHK